MSAQPSFSTLICSLCSCNQALRAPVHIGDLTVSDVIGWASPATHIVHRDDAITGNPNFKHDFTGGVNALG